MTNDQIDRLEAYLKEDRQWKRDHRMSHARWQMKQCKTAEEKQFWKEVIKINTHTLEKRA